MRIDARGVRRVPGRGVLLSGRRLRTLARRAVDTRSRRRISDGLRDEETAHAFDPLLDGWLRTAHGERLDAIDAACGADAGPDAYSLFSDLGDDLWTLLLSRSYSGWPNIRALLPDLPEPALQETWNGRYGLALATQSRAFYAHVKATHATHGAGPLGEATLLDFGCGWGRLTRFFARDVRPGALLGCDPVEDILDVCRASRVPARLERSDFVPERVPFDQVADVAVSFSVFTHISESAASSCIRALHSAIAPGGVLVLTVRPPAYLDLDPRMHAARDALDTDPVTALQEPRYVFVPHEAEPQHPQYGSGEMTYGEAVISLPYVREQWGEMFELVEVKLFPDDLYQVALTLRRRA